MLKLIFVDFIFSKMKTQVSAYLNPMQNSVFQFSVADLHSVQPGLTKRVLLVRMGHKFVDIEEFTLHLSSFSFLYPF